MKKSDLKTGMIAQTRNGKLFMVFRDYRTVNENYDIALIGCGVYMYDSDLDNDLMCNNHDYDIIKLYLKHTDNLSLTISDCLLYWKRKFYTYKDYVLEKLPNINIRKDGYPFVKPCILFDDFVVCEYHNCCDCVNCWDKEYK